MYNPLRQQQQPQEQQQYETYAAAAAAQQQGGHAHQAAGAAKGYPHAHAAAQQQQHNMLPPYLQQQQQAYPQQQQAYHHQQQQQQQQQQEAPQPPRATHSTVPPAVKKVHRHLLPQFAALVALCYMDRTSLAFAALQLCHEPWFSPKVYGLGSGIFYAGYVLFQVPSNLMLERFGARLWLPIITSAWGLVAMACVFISGPTSFYVLRLALGVAEAGAFPAIWHVCGQFYPATHITLPYSVVEASVAVSQVAAAPVAAGLLQLSGVWGLAGWQHLFLAEGVATLVMAAVLRWRLPDSVATARFLSADDKLWLLQRLAPATTAAAAAAEGEEDSMQAFLQATPPQHHHSSSLLPKQQRSGAAGSEVALSSCPTRHHQHRSGPRLQQLPEQQKQQHEDVQVLLEGGADACHLHRDGHHKQQQQQRGDGSPDADASARRLLSGATSGSVSGAAAPKAATPSVSLSSGQQLLSTFRNRLILHLMVLKALKDMCLDGLVYFVPLLVHALIDGSESLNPHATSSSSASGSSHCGGRASQLHAVLLSAIPFGAAAAAALMLGHSSERTQERRLHVALPLLLGGLVFGAMPALLLLTSRVPAFLSVAAAVVAADATTGAFWTWVHMAAAPGTQAVSLAAVNSVGKAGGMLGPLSFGLLLSATGSYIAPILLVATALMAGGVLALVYPGDGGRSSRRGLG